MPTTIEVNKQSVETLLGSGKSKPFVIPEYQRPYAWTDEQVETLLRIYGSLLLQVVEQKEKVPIFWEVWFPTKMKMVSRK